MPELRLNLITREWVIILCERAKKPEDFRQRKEKRYRPRHLESCPFCPGNESKTPDEIMRHPEGEEWKVRVAPNKYAVLDAQGERFRDNEGLRHLVTGVGRHEVIIESPFHDMSLALMDVEDVLEVLNVYKKRFLDCFRDRRLQHVIIFKNHGVASGTTIMHPHTQLIGTPVVPMQIRQRIEECMRYFDNTGECLICGTVKDELKDGRRVIVDSEHFVSFIPYAALSPFHTWLFTKKHQQSFGQVTDEEMKDLAHVLKSTLARMHFGLDDPDYNMVIRSLSPYRSRSEYIHWYMSIVPHVINISGFEMGSGMYVNASMPEQVAEFLRGVRVP
jgi:UDPglucose--hexose-1-phosphate uridylyltransferase